ncbi:MAG: hypothetical protein ACKO01_12315 [Erythrobacter sp.]
MIDFGVVEHALIAVIVQGLIGLTTGRWWAGAAAASGYFIGREVAQAEYRWIEQFGEGLRANMPWNAVFDARVWQTADQAADWLGPLLATVTVAVVATRARRGVDGRP